MEKILVTAALPYINGPPHFGHIVGCILPADIFSRFQRISGRKVLFVGGTDENGTPTELIVRKNKLDLKEFKRVMRNIHKRVYDKFEISFDIFGNTSSDYHAKFVREFFLRLKERGFVYEGEVRMFFCENCERFLPGRYVEGTCKFCGYPNANGDQCESCGKTMGVDTLIDPVCKICGSRPIVKSSKHLFFKLSSLSDDIKRFLDERKEILRKNVLNFSYSWIEQGLKDRCITRDIENGIPVPGLEEKVFYVWFDALLGYISFVGEKLGEKGMEEWWKDEKVRIYQFLGKDNIPFHTIFWPGMLMAHGGYVLPYNVVGLNYLLFEGKKFSKSKRIGVFCDKILESNIDIEALRFYLSLSLPETSDSNFSWEEFMDRVNKDLIGNIANFVWRALNLAKGIKLPLREGYDHRFDEFLKVSKKYIEDMEKVEIRKAVGDVILSSGVANSYLNEKEPWRMDKDSKEYRVVIYNSLEMARIIGIMMYPFTPSFSERIMECLGLKEGEISIKRVGKVGCEYKKLKMPEKPFFERVKKEDIERWRKELSETYSIKDLMRIFG